MVNLVEQNMTFNLYLQDPIHSIGYLAFRVVPIVAVIIFHSGILLFVIIRTIIFTLPKFLDHIWLLNWHWTY